MSGLEVMEPSACTWCGIARRGHGRQYADAAGWHEWEQPSQEQVLARMKARRLQLAVARAGALPVPVGGERTLDVVEEELTGVNLALWEEVQAYARLRLALASTQRGRRDLRVRIAELEKANAGLDDLRIRALDKNDTLRARIAELEAQLRTANGALDDAVKALRADRDALTAQRYRREVRDSYQQLAVQAREDRDYEGETVVLQQLAERETVWAREDVLAAEFAADPLALKPYVPGPSADASVDKLMRLLAPTQALPESGGAR